MSDLALQYAGKLLLTVSIVGLVVGIVGYNLTSPATEARYGFEDALGIGALLLLVGATAWALAHIRSTVAQDHVNAGLRRIGFLLLVGGVLAGITGIIADGLTQVEISPRIGIEPIVTIGFWVAIIGAVIVALSHRKRTSRAQPSHTRG